MERICLECKESILGRSDKKFCTDYCRNLYNNRQNTGINNYARKVNRILRNNRRILFDLNPDGKAKVPQKKLLSLGYNFTYFTSTYTTKTGTVYYYCYDMGYLPIENDYYALVIKKEYTE